MPCATLAIATIIARASAERRRARHPTASNAAYLVAAQPFAAEFRGCCHPLLSNGGRSFKRSTTNLFLGVWCAGHGAGLIHSAQYKTRICFLQGCSSDLSDGGGSVATADLIARPTSCSAIDVPSAALAPTTVIARASAKGRSTRHPAATAATHLVATQASAIHLWSYSNYFVDGGDRPCHIVGGLLSHGDDIPLVSY